jgi:hypothetical protein
MCPARGSDYAEERRLVRFLAFKDVRTCDIVARMTEGMKFFTEGEVLIDPRGKGSLQQDLPMLS